MPIEIINTFILGLIAGAIPGPVLTMIFTEILQKGFFKSVKIILIAMVIDIVVATFCVFSLYYMGVSQAWFYGLSIIGAVVLLWISVSIWKTKKIDSGDHIEFGVGKIILLVLSNGLLWTFWITICVPKAIALGDIIPFGKLIFIVVFEVAWLLSTTTIAFIFSRFRGILSNQKVVGMMFKLFALVFVYFAIDMIYKSLNYFLS